VIEKKNNIKYKLLKLLVIVYFIFPLLALITTFYYLSKANYYGSVLVVNMNDTTKIKSLNVTGLTPFYNIIESPNKNDYFDHSYPRFYSSISFKSSYDDVINVKILLSNDTVISDIITIQPNETLIYNFNKLPKYNKSRKLFDLFKLLSTNKTVIIICTIILIVFLIAITIIINKYLKTEFDNPIRNLINSKLRIYILSLFFLSICTFAFWNSQINIINQVVQKMDDLVHIELNVDQIDYQTISVNFAQKNKHNINGILDSSINYKLNFDKNKSPVRNSEARNKLHYLSGIQCLHRFPAYPYFVGTIYKIFDNSPLYIKYFQLFLLIASLSFLPLIGYEIWNLKGLWAGLISMPFMLLLTIKTILYLTPDVATISINILILFQYIRFRKDFKYLNAILLGVLLGFSFLIKSSLMFFVIFLFSDLLIKIIIHKDYSIIKKGIVLFTTFVLIWAPYNIYAIVQHKKNKYESRLLLKDIENGIDYCAINKKMTNCDYGRYIYEFLYPLDGSDINSFNEVLSPVIEKTQAIDIRNCDNYSLKTIRLALLKMNSELPDYFFIISIIPINTGLDMHNEYVTDGGMHPEWRIYKSSFYQSDNINNKSFITSVIKFYSKYPNKIFTVSYSKLKKIFSELFVFKILPLFISLFIIINLLNFKPRKYGIFMALMLLIILLSFVNPTVANIATIITLCILSFSRKIIKEIKLPIEFTFLILSLVCFTVVTFALGRYSLYYIFPLYLIVSYTFISIVIVVNISIQKFIHRLGRYSK